MTDKERIEKLVKAWKEILKPDRNWILFEHGTCFVSTDNQIDIIESAKKVLKEWGPVVPGTPLGDFSVSFQRDQDDNLLGWLVDYGHPDLHTFVFIDDIEDIFEFSGNSNGISKQEAAETYPHMIIGMTARKWREEDSKKLKIIHTE